MAARPGEEHKWGWALRALEHYTATIRSYKSQVVVVVVVVILVIVIV